MENSKREALAKHLSCSIDDLIKEDCNLYELSVFSQGNREYAIGTDDEADDACTEYVKENVWAFNRSFLAGFTGLPEEMFKFAETECEGANEAILTCIKNTNDGLDAFVAEAVGADGRGHFLSGYDGEEAEQGEFFIYRIN